MLVLIQDLGRWTNTMPPAICFPLYKFRVQWLELVLNELLYGLFILC